MTIDAAEKPIFHLARGGSSGSGHRHDSGFLVFGGAAGRAEVVPSFETHNYMSLRNALLADGTLEVEGDRATLTRDYLFSSPSAAAGVLMGRAANGKTEWRHDTGVTLGDYEQGRTAVAAEQGFRRRWYQAHQDRFAADHEAVDRGQQSVEGFDASAAEALQLLETLRSTTDVQAFQEGMQAWAVKPDTLAFNGFSGQMLLNQLVKRSETPTELGRLLADVLTVPESDEEARSKIQSLVAYVETIRVGAHPAPGHVPFLLSYFWALAERPEWPVIWSSAAAYIEYSTGQSLPSDPEERYLTFIGLVRELGVDVVDFEMTASWWRRSRAVFVDEVLCDRADYNFDRDGVTLPAHEDNGRAMVSVAGYLGNELVEQVSKTVGRTLAVGRPPLNWTKGHPRADLWVDWAVKEKGAAGLGIRLWLNRNGLAIVVRPGLQRQGWYDEVAPILEAADFEGCQILGGPESRIGENKELYGRRGEFVYGRWYERDELADLDVREAVVSVAAQLQPLLDQLVTLALGGEIDSTVEDGTDSLEELVRHFRRERGYPTSADEEDQADRRKFAGTLAEDNIALADVADLRRVWNTGRYGSPGPMPELNRSFRDADAAEYDRMLESIRYLCWDDARTDAERIDQLLEDDKLRISGLGESVIMKLLAVTHPERYLPVYPYSGPKGKRRMLQLLQLGQPTGGSRGELQVRSNDLLRRRLDRHFPGDPWGMTQFLYWYRTIDEEGEREPEGDPLAALADELLVEREFLDDIVSLLEDKGQVIFYGPPGTGKTYLARKLAEALAPDATRRALVQFHPSSSYEDFFEGYRPESGGDGDMTYRLTPGPLALMADQAANAPGRRHIMIIDEINRANLPKVLGELLFLLEYRGESVRTLYRPEDAFELPQDLWFIGTMNTADRSIALVDAALRRRFHFIPFFPNHGPMRGLLDRWLAANEEPDWVGELLAQVNDELEEQLGGPHLQIGPSHFMKPGLNKENVRRIWQYNIEPFIEDQFFGDQQQVDRFRFEKVYNRFMEDSGRRELEELEADETIDAADPMDVGEDNLPTTEA